MIKVALDIVNKRQFDKTLQEYVKLNKRATAGLVEHTAKKVITGFNPRSASKRKIKGLRHYYYDERATPSKIRKEAKQRLAQGKGTLRPPKKTVSKRSVPPKSVAQAINWRAKRGTAWLQATMLYKQWRANSIPKNRKYDPSLDSKHKPSRGGKPDTSVQIRTKGKRPYVLWKSNVPGVIAVKFKNRAINRALRDAKLDMKEYIRRKHKQIKMRDRR
jgi:hypothetical protein